EGEQIDADLLGLLMDCDLRSTGEEDDRHGADAFPDQSILQGILLGHRVASPSLISGFLARRAALSALFRVRSRAFLTAGDPPSFQARPEQPGLSGARL